MRVIDESSKEYYLETTKIIKDLVHGYINLTQFEIKIIDNASFQRLKDIRQLTCHHVYPEARHTRFEHSLGVLELTRKAINSLNWNGVIFKKEKDEKPIINDQLKFNVCIAALLHDVGHCPFSHMGESEFTKADVINHLAKSLKNLKKNKVKITQDLMKKINVKNVGQIGSVHEQLSCIVIIENFFDILKNVSFVSESKRICVDFDLIIRCILGIEYDVQTQDDFENYKVNNAIIRLINSSIFDMDKLDYIMRDSYFTGIGTPKIDTKRLFRNMYFDNNYSIVFTSKAVPSLQNMIDARDGLYMYVYNHHAVVFSDFLNTYIIRKITHSTMLFNELCNEQLEEKKNITTINSIDFVSKDYLFSIDAILKKYRSDSDWLSLLNTINTHYDKINNEKIVEKLNKEFKKLQFEIEDNNCQDLCNRINTAIELVHQLKNRQFLKPWWKTVFEFTNFMQKNFPDDNIRKKIGKYICNGGELKGKYKLDAPEFRSQIAKHVTYISREICEIDENDNFPLIAPLSEGEFFIVQRSTRFFEPDTIEKIGICLKASEITGAPKEADYVEQDYYVKSLTRIIPQKDYTSLYAKEGFYVFTAPIEQYKSLKNTNIDRDDKKWQKHYKCIENIFVFVATTLVTNGEQDFVEKFQQKDENKTFLERKDIIKDIENKSMANMAKEYIDKYIR